jgi:hypothetical protein
MAVMIPAYKAARSQDDANKKLAAVLRATGGAAGLTFEELDKMAGGLQKVTDFEDLDCERYSTREQALEGHEVMVKKWEAK